MSRGAGLRARLGRGLRLGLGPRVLLLSTLAVLVGSATRVEAAPPKAIALESGPTKAPAESGFFVEILVLHASNSKKGIDARIGSMPELAKPPFSSYDSYELLERAKLPLSKPAPKTLKLPNGRVLETKLLEVLGPEVVRIHASINQPGGQKFLPLLEVKAKVGQAFIVAGQSHKKGILVLVIRVVR